LIIRIISKRKSKEGKEAKRKKQKEKRKKKKEKRKKFAGLEPATNATTASVHQDNVSAPGD
jgi:hypothetical protein